MAICSEMNVMRTTIKDMEEDLSTWSGEVTALQTTVSGPKSEMLKLREKCEDMEGSMWRCNIQIVGIVEEPDSSSF